MQTQRQELTAEGMRKISSQMFFGIVVVSLLIALLLPGCWFLDFRESEFENVDALRASGMIQRGWVPDSFPESAVEIYEAHDQDTNRVWIRFNLEIGASDEMDSFLAGSEKIQLADFSFARPPVGLRWWYEEDLAVPEASRLLEDPDLGFCLLWSVPPRRTYFLYCSTDLENVIRDLTWAAAEPKV